MLDRLIDVVLQFGSDVLPGIIIRDYEEAVLLRFGKFKIIKEQEDKIKVINNISEENKDKKNNLIKTRTIQHKNKQLYEAINTNNSFKIIFNTYRNPLKRLRERINELIDKKIEIDSKIINYEINEMINEMN